MFKSSMKLGALFLALAHVIALASAVESSDLEGKVIVPTAQDMASFIEKSLTDAGSEICMKMALCSMVADKQESSDVQKETMHMVDFIDFLGTSQDNLKSYSEAMDVGEEKDVNCAEVFKCESSTQEAMTSLNAAALAAYKVIQPILAGEDRAIQVAELMASYETDECFKKRICAFSKDHANDPKGFKQKYEGSNLDDYVFVRKILPLVPFFSEERLDVLKPTIDAFNLGLGNGDCDGQLSCSITDAKVLEQLEEATKVLCKDGSCPPTTRNDS